MDNSTAESFSIAHDMFEENVQAEVENFTDVTISELLISFASLRPALWYRRLPLIRRTKLIKDQLWEEIVTEFGGNTDLTAAILEKKLKNLRDKYIKTRN